MSVNLEQSAANLIGILAPALKDDTALAQRLTGILGQIAQLPLNQHRFQPVAPILIQNFAIVCAREFEVNRLPASFAHRLAIDFLLRTFHILSTLKEAELQIYMLIMAFAATFEKGQITIDQIHQEAPTTLTTAQIDAAITSLEIQKFIAGSPQIPHTLFYAPIVGFFYTPQKPSELLSTPWQLIYKDLFDLSSPAEVQAQDQGLIAGLRELWLNHLSTGLQGLSRFTLNCETPPSQIEIQSTNLETVRRWIYREKDPNQPVTRERADVYLLQTLAATHAKLIVGNKTIDPILHLALTSPDISDFTQSLEALLAK